MCTTVSVGRTSAFVGNLVSCGEIFFHLARADSVLFQNLRGSIVCFISYQIYVYVHVSSVCNLSFLVARNEIERNKASMCHYLDQIYLLEWWMRRLATSSGPFYTAVFCRPKIFHQNFSTRPTTQGVWGIESWAFYTFCDKSIQNGSYEERQHVRYQRVIVKCSKMWKFALLVKEKGRFWCTNIHMSRKKSYMG